jgi:membrane protease YdiL (CAAX protease family)
MSLQAKTTTSSSSISKQLIAYFFLAFLFSWAIAVPLALAHQGVVPPLFPQWAHYLVPFGPLLSAVVVTAASEGSAGLKDLLRRLSMLRVCPTWWTVSLSPLLIGSILLFITNRLTGSAVHLTDLGMLSYLPPLGIWALPFWFLTFGLGEETGWRGFALPRLLKGHSALAAAMIVAAFWALWHLPQFFYHFDPSMALGWLVGLTAGSVLLTWLYNSASESIFMVAIWHACFNFITGSQADVGILPVALTVIVILLAALTIVRTKLQNLTSI